MTDHLAEVAARALANHHPVLALPAQCDPKTDGDPDQPPLGVGMHITDPDDGTPPTAPLAAQVLAAIPDLPDDVRAILTARITPPDPEHWTRTHGDARDALTGRPAGPTTTGQQRTAVEAVYDPLTHTTRIGWTTRRLTADQAATVRARAQEDHRA